MWGSAAFLPRVLRLSRKIGIPLIRGEQLMDMTCVENVAPSHSAALETKAHGQVYNITNETKTFKYLTETTLKGLGGNRFAIGRFQQVL